MALDLGDGGPVPRGKAEEGLHQGLSGGVLGCGRLAVSSAAAAAAVVPTSAVSAGAAPAPAAAFVAVGSGGGAALLGRARFAADVLLLLVAVVPLTELLQLGW